MYIFVYYEQEIPNWNWWMFAYWIRKFFPPCALIIRPMISEEMNGTLKLTNIFFSNFLNYFPIYIKVEDMTLFDICQTLTLQSILFKTLFQGVKIRIYLIF